MLKWMRASLATIACYLVCFIWAGFERPSSYISCYGIMHAIFSPTPVFLLLGSSIFWEWGFHRFILRSSSLPPPASSFIPHALPLSLGSISPSILCTSTFSRVQQNLRIQVYCALTALLVVIARLLWLLSFQGEDREIRASGWWRVWSCEWPNKWTAHWSNAQIAIFAERTWCREKCAGIQVSYLLFYLDFFNFSVLPVRVTYGAFSRTDNIFREVWALVCWNVNENRCIA